MESIDAFKTLKTVGKVDERWTYFGRTLEQHHSLVADCVLKESVPEDVKQHFDNARNTFLYAWFAYRLTSVASLMLHVAGERALLARAIEEKVPKGKRNLQSLLEIAIERKWIVDDHFQITRGFARQAAPGSQEYCEMLAEAFRGIRNELAHGGTVLTSDSHFMFPIVADMINQLFD